MHRYTPDQNKEEEKKKQKHNENMGKRTTKHRIKLRSTSTIIKSSTKMHCDQTAVKYFGKIRQNVI